MKQTTTNAGFTLVEMLVVLAILAVTVGVTLPYVRGPHDARILDAAAHTLATRLRETQEAAIFNNEEQELGIDLKKKLILNPIVAIPQDVTIGVTTAQEEHTVDHASIRFFADGGSTGGIIRLSKGDSAQEISVNWLTGAIVISKALSHEKS